jgi:transposase InsO family protein
MELWQLDVVGDIRLADGTELKALTGIDDHSRFCVVVGLMERATSRAVCGHFVDAMRIHGVPDEVLTDNGKVFTGRRQRCSSTGSAARTASPTASPGSAPPPPPARSNGSTRRSGTNSWPDGS